MNSFTNFGKPLLTQSAKNRILAYIRRRPDAIKPYVSSVLNAYDGLSKVTNEALSIIMPEIIQLRLLFTVPFTPSIMVIQPHTLLDKHRDTVSGGRLCSIIDAVSNTSEYAPLNFWESFEASHPSEVLNIDALPAIVNLQSIHSVYNKTPVQRINFQVSFALPYEQIVHLHLEGKLIRQAQA
jgi:hypothetical protein